MVIIRTMAVATSIQAVSPPSIPEVCANAGAAASRNGKAAAIVRPQGRANALSFIFTSV